MQSLSVAAACSMSWASGVQLCVGVFRACELHVLLHRGLPSPSESGTVAPSVHTCMAGHHQILLNYCNQSGVTAKSQVEVICRTPSIQAHYRGPLGPTWPCSIVFCLTFELNGV